MWCNQCKPCWLCHMSQNSRAQNSGAEPAPSGNTEWRLEKLNVWFSWDSCRDAFRSHTLTRVGVNSILGSMPFPVNSGSTLIFLVEKLQNRIDPNSVTHSIPFIRVEKIIIVLSMFRSRFDVVPWMIWSHLSFYYDVHHQHCEDILADNVLLWLDSFKIFFQCLPLSFPPCFILCFCRM